MPTQENAQNSTANADEQELDPQALWKAELAARENPDASATADADAAAAAAAAEQPGEKEPAAAVVPPQPTADERFAALETQNRELARLLKETTGRVGSLQSTLAKSAKDAAKAATEAPSAAQQAAAIEDPAEWKQLMQDFPEWGDAMQKKLDVTVGQLRKELAAKPGAAPAADDMTVDQRVAAAIEAAEYRRLERKHPTWREIVQAPAYKAWADKQPAEVKALADSPDSEDAIAYFDRYAADSKTTQAAAVAAARKDKLTLAASDKGHPPRATRMASDDELDPAAIWKQEAAKRKRA